MAKNKRIDGLELDEDLKHQQREWRVQRLAWVVMGLVIVAAMLGVLGKGPLADAQLSDPTGVLTAHYFRFERYRSPTSIEVIVGPNVAKEGKVALSFNREFIDSVEISRIDPEPESVKSDMNRIRYEFELTDAAQPAHIYFDYEYERFGAAAAHLSLEGGPELTLSQFIYP